MAEQNIPIAGPSSDPFRRAYGEDEQKAAIVIQRHYRGHRARRRVNGMKLESSARWDDLVKQSGERTYANQQLSNQNDISSRWSRAVHAASRLQAGKGVAEGSNIPQQETPNLSKEERRRRKATFWGKLGMGLDVGKVRDETEELPYVSKSLEQQHWLEMIDGKHRYGSNMKYYFRKWKEADTQDNFFRWLDRGEGKDMDLEELPRERLEKERIVYLSAEQRLNYLVKVDPDGLLRWVHSGEYVDTAAGKWKDGGYGSGIVPTTDDDEDEDDQGGAANSGSDTSSVVSDTYSAISSDLQENEDTHYAGNEGENDGWLAKKTQGITPSGIRKKLLRKTVRRNTWIYVCDMNQNMFIGIKKSGNFQHSSFLAGGRVASAGLIVVKRGLIKNLNPHSGHYRSSIQHYRAFIAQIEEKGADLSHVKVAKSVMLLWGLSHYAAATKQQRDLVSRFKAAVGLPHPPTEAEKSAELQKNAEREEREHQERLRAVREAEDKVGGDEEKQQVKKEVLYGRPR